MNKHRPKNLNLLTIRFPIPAIVSILHRISGVLLALYIPFVLWALRDSLASEPSFTCVRTALAEPFPKFILWVFLSTFLFHFFAGIRHLLMDIHIGDELRSGRLAAQITMVVSFLAIIFVGIWLW